MNGKYYVALDAWGELLGYPAFFDWEIDWDKCDDPKKTGALINCTQEVIELKVKHKKISFDYCSAAGYLEYFVSEDFLNLIKEVQTPLYKSKPIRFLNKKGDDVSTKKYFLIMFNVEKTEYYVNEKECEYVIPDEAYPDETELISLSINYERLNSYDIAPSLSYGLPTSLFVNSAILEAKAVKNMNFEFLEIDNAPTVLYKREHESYAPLNGLKRYKETDLQK